MYRPSRLSEVSSLLTFVVGYSQPRSAGILLSLVKPCVARHRRLPKLVPHCKHTFYFPSPQAFSISPSTPSPSPEPRARLSISIIKAEFSMAGSCPNLNRASSDGHSLCRDKTESKGEDFAIYCARIMVVDLADNTSSRDRQVLAFYFLGASLPLECFLT